MCERQAKSTTHVKSCLLSNQTVECTLAPYISLCYVILLFLVIKEQFGKAMIKKAECGISEMRDHDSPLPSPSQDPANMTQDNHNMF